MSKDNHEMNLEFYIDLERNAACFKINDLSLEDLYKGLALFDLGVLKLLLTRMSKADATAFFFDSFEIASEWHKQGL